jgi:hypothetical protein
MKNGANGCFTRKGHSGFVLVGTTDVWIPSPEHVNLIREAGWVACHGTDASSGYADYSRPCD